MWMQYVPVLVLYAWVAGFIAAELKRKGHGTLVLLASFVWPLACLYVYIRGTSALEGGEE